MRKLCSLLCGLLLLGGFGYSQKPVDPLLTDTAFYDYDEIFSELDYLLDSLYTPRSFGVASISAGTGFFNYGKVVTGAPNGQKRFLLSPTLGYYHKSGVGISASTSLINDSSRMYPYQFSLTGSYDYLKNRKFVTGISLTHFITKENLPFYTSPLQNELYGYFTYRDHWLKPSLATSYGWGSRQDVHEQIEIIEKIKKTETVVNGNGNNGNGNNGNGNGNNGNGNGNNGNGNGNNGNNGNTGGDNGGGTTGGTVTTVVENYERIADFSLMASVRHDFYFLHPFFKNDYIRLTPQLTFTSGTQQFGFNSPSNSYFVSRKSATSSLINTQNIALDNRFAFQPLSLTAQLRTEYSIGKFFIQPQLFVDYYFPAPDKNVTTTFFINAGFIF